MLETFSGKHKVLQTLIYRVYLNPINATSIKNDTNRILNIPFNCWINIIKPEVPFPQIISIQILKNIRALATPRSFDVKKKKSL